MHDYNQARKLTVALKSTIGLYDEASTNFLLKYGTINSVYSAV